MGKKKPKPNSKKKNAKVSVEDVIEAREDEQILFKMKNRAGVKPDNKKKKDQTRADDDLLGELFTIDTKGSFEGISQTSRRKLARAKLFPPKGPNIGLSASESQKIERAERQVEASKRPALAKAPEVFDLWGAPPPKAIDRDSRLLKLKAAVKVPHTLHQKVGTAPAVLPAPEGQSMNPHMDAYEDLVCQAAAVELEREREVEALDRKMRPMTVELRDAIGEERLRGMDEHEKMNIYRTLCLKQTDELRVAEEEGGAGRTAKLKNKSNALRNNRKKRRVIDAKEDQEKAQRKLEKTVGEVGSYLQDMKQKGEWEKNRKQYRESLREKRKELEATDGVVPKKRKIGGGEFVEDAAMMPDMEAGPALRSMPLRTSAVRERLMSVTRRGLLPPPSTNSKQTKSWLKKKNNKLRNSRKFMSPLLRDNLLLR